MLLRLCLPLCARVPQNSVEFGVVKSTMTSWCSLPLSRPGKAGGGGQRRSAPAEHTPASCSGRGILPTGAVSGAGHSLTSQHIPASKSALVNVSLPPALPSGSSQAGERLTPAAPGSSLSWDAAGVSLLGATLCRPQGASPAPSPVMPRIFHSPKSGKTS